MMQMTKKKAKRLEDNGALLVGFIYRDKDGDLAYVEDGAVRWLDADKRAAFMFPHGKDDIEPPPKGEIIYDSRVAECSQCHSVGLLVVNTDKCFNCSVLLTPPPPPLRYVNEDKPVSRSGVIFNWAGIVLMALVFYVGLFWGIPFASFANTTEESMGCSLTEFILIFHALVGLAVWASVGAVNLQSRANKSKKAVRVIEEL